MPLLPEQDPANTLRRVDMRNKPYAAALGVVGGG